MQSMIEAVELFNKTSGNLVNTVPTIPPTKYQNFFVAAMQEELTEYQEAIQANDIVEVADAHMDLLYFLLGSFCAHGLKDKIQPIFDEVQRSNMSKFSTSMMDMIDRGFEYKDKEGMMTEVVKIGEMYVIKRASDGKTLKGKDYFKPNLAQFFEEGK